MARQTEARNPESERNPKPECQATIVRRRCFRIRDSGFGFLSGFGIRHSDLEQSHAGIARKPPKLYLGNMGRTYHFDCPHCQYRACVSGGADTGLNCAVQTIVCLDCRQLFDVFTRRRRPVDHDTPVPASVPARSGRKLLPTGIIIPPLRLLENVWSIFSSARRSTSPVKQWHWENVKLICPVVGSHRVKIWNAPGRCPRCGNYLEQNGFPWRLWD